MDLEKTLQFVENYARGYIGYLLAFFGEPAATKDAEAADPFRTVMIFGIISTFLGAAFGFHGVSGHFPTGEVLIRRISVELAYWVALAALLFVLLKAMRAPSSAMDALLVVFSVMPVGYALGGYASYLMSMAARIWSTAQWATLQAYGASVAVQMVISAIYFPVYIARMAALGRARTTIGSTVLVVVVAAVQFFYFLHWADGQAKGR